MGESTLLLTMDDLKAGIADHLGFTRDSTAWTTRQTEQITASLNAGLRQAYFPPLLDGQAAPHTWTFLKPTFRLSTVAEQTEYDLPDDLFGIEDDITLGSESILSANPTIRMVSPEKMLALRQSVSYSGVPVHAAMRTKTADGHSTPRYELMIFPTPDTAYTLTMRYCLIPQALTADASYPLGGAIHSEMLMASCRAAADALYNDNPRGGTWAEFMTRLAVSVAIDMRVGAPATLGRNTTRRRSHGLSYRHRYGGRVTFD